jgi:hypothetical protein
MLLPPLSVDETDHQQNNHNPPQAHTLNSLVADLDSPCLGLDLDWPDFHRGRFVN